MDYKDIKLKTLTTPYASAKTTDIIYSIEKALKAGEAVRVVCTYTDHFCPGDLIQQRRERCEAAYIDHMKYIYGDALQVVTNEDNLRDYYRLAYSGHIFPHRYRVFWDTLEGGHWYGHAKHDLIEARNKKHARDIFRIWWDAKESGRKPHPRYAFHVTIEREDRKEVIE